MIVQRVVFTAKPGMASRMAKLFHEVWKDLGLKVRVMTDVTGDFNQVVMEIEHKNLKEFEEMEQRYATDQKIRDKMKGYTEMYMTGRRELWQVVE